MRKYIFYFLILFACQSIIAQDKKDDFDLSKVKFIYEDSVVYLNYQNRRDSLVFPIMPDASKEMQEALRLENIIGVSVDSVKAEYERCGCGVTSFNYLVNFQNEEVISFIFMTKFYGAYPTDNNFYKTFVLKSGKQHQLKDELTHKGQEFILKEYKNILLKRISDYTLSELEKGAELVLNGLEKTVRNLTIEDLNQDCTMFEEAFFVSIDDNIPHYAKAFSIDMSVEFSSTELKKFKRSDSKILK